MEVRQLAEQSPQATARVQDILGEIQETVGTAVMAQVEQSVCNIVEIAQRLEDAAARYQV